MVSPAWASNAPLHNILAIYHLATTIQGLLYFTFFILIHLNLFILIYPLIVFNALHMIILPLPVTKHFLEIITEDLMQ